MTKDDVEIVAYFMFAVSAAGLAYFERRADPTARRWKNLVIVAGAAVALGIVSLCLR